MTTVTFLIGLPASGKSTWRELSRGGQYVASSDDFIESMAKSEDKTYNEVFQKCIEPATKHFNHIVSFAVTEKKPLIVDRTNLTVKSRSRVLCRIPFDWHKVAIVFSCKDFEEWKRRLMNRPGKTIPVEVIQRMMKDFEAPTLAEGFDEILQYET